MADRYWIGGSGTWTDTAHWSTSSGGSGGASVPGSNDTAYFDGNSGTGVCTINTGSSKALGWLDCTGYGGAITQSGGNLTVSRNVTIAGSWSVDSLIMTVFLNPTTLTTNGTTLVGSLTVNASANDSYPVELQDDLTINGGLAHARGGIDTNGYDITATSYTVTSSNNMSLDLGSGTHTVGSWNANNSNLTLTGGTSTIVCSGDFNPGHLKTYYNVDIATSGATSPTIGGSGSVQSTYNTFTISQPDATARTINWEENNTFTATSFSLNGSSGKVNTFRSVVSGTRYWFEQATGSLHLEYVDLKDCWTKGTADFRANPNTCTDSGGNEGWVWAAGGSPLGFFNVFKVFHNTAQQ